MSLVNHYRRKLVAQANEKACAICHRPTSVVLMSVDSKDWFYCCQQHLKDSSFAQPIIDQAAEAARLKEIEIKKAKAEYEAKEARKLELEKEKAEKEKKTWLSMANPFGATKPAKPKSPEPSVPAPVEAKEFSLHRTLFQHRCNMKQQAAQEAAKRAQWQNISFPSVPGQ